VPKGLDQNLVERNVLKRLVDFNFSNVLGVNCLEIGGGLSKFGVDLKTLNPVDSRECVGSKS